MTLRQAWANSIDGDWLTYHTAGLDGIQIQRNFNPSGVEINLKAALSDHWSVVQPPPPPMTFLEAMAAYVDGSKIRRRAWEPGEYVSLTANLFSGNPYSPMIHGAFNRDNVKENDWEVVDR